MTGRLAYYLDGEGKGPDPGHTRPRLDFENGAHLAYVSVRRLREISLVADPDRFVEEKGLSPDDLDPRRVDAPHLQMRRVLDAAIDAGVKDFPDRLLLPHRDGDGRCPECGGEVERIEVSGCATYFCPTRQGRSP